MNQQFWRIGPSAFLGTPAMTAIVARSYPYPLNVHTEALSSLSLYKHLEETPMVESSVFFAIPKQNEKINHNSWCVDKNKYSGPLYIYLLIIYCYLQYFSNLIHLLFWKNILETLEIHFKRPGKVLETANSTHEQTKEKLQIR